MSLMRISRYFWLNQLRNGPTHKSSHPFFFVLLLLLLLQGHSLSPLHRCTQLSANPKTQNIFYAATNTKDFYETKPVLKQNGFQIFIFNGWVWKVDFFLIKCSVSLDYWIKGVQSSFSKMARRHGWELPAHTFQVHFFFTEKAVFFLVMLSKMQYFW